MATLYSSRLVHLLYNSATISDAVIAARKSVIVVENYMKQKDLTMKRDDLISYFCKVVFSRML